MLDKYLVPKANGSEVKVYYLKMRGDYYRYLGEVSNSAIKDNELADRERKYFSGICGESSYWANV